MATEHIAIFFTPGQKVYYITPEGRICFAYIFSVQLHQKKKGEATYPVTYFLDRGDSMDIPPLQLPAKQMYSSLQQAINKTAEQQQLFQFIEEHVK